MSCAYGIPAEVIAERCGVDVSTARRWKSGATRIPRTAELVLEADLGAFGRPWRGWRIDGEELVSPEGWRISCGDVLSVPLMRQQIATYQAEFRQAQLDEFEEQPLPSVVDPGVGESNTGERVLEHEGLDTGEVR